jgi:signal transduction histidine kinase
MAPAALASWGRLAWRRATKAEAYLATVAFTVIATAVRVAVDGYIFGAQFFTFCLSVFLAAFVGGIRAGLLAVLLATLSAWYFLVPPYTFTFLVQGEPLTLLAFVVAGIAVVCLIHGLQTLAVTVLNEIAERERALARLESARDDLESFSYSVSHDLRTPLRAIEGFSRALLEDYAEKLDEEGRREINIVCDSTRRMSRMIDDILAFSRVGRTAMKVCFVNMQAEVRQAIKDLEPATAGRCVNFDIGDLPPAQGDGAMLQRVWVNLLGNAVKYTGPRDRAIIQIGASPKARQCTLSATMASVST